MWCLYIYSLLFASSPNLVFTDQCSVEIHDLVYVKNTYGNRKLRTVVPSRGRCSSSSKVIFSSLDSANVCCGAAADMLQLNRVEKGAVGAQADFEHNGKMVPLDQKLVTANFDLGQVATSACTICWASEEHKIFLVQYFQ